MRELCSPLKGLLKNSQASDKVLQETKSVLKCRYKGQLNSQNMLFFLVGFFWGADLCSGVLNCDQVLGQGTQRQLSYDETHSLFHKILKLTQI